MFFDPRYFMYVGPGIRLSLLASFYVCSTFNKYAKVSTSKRMTGAEVAAAILRAAGVQGVRIEPVDGSLTDHYDPSEKVLRLSSQVYGGRSISAAGVAAHEVGHAIQHAEGHALMSLRQNLVYPAQHGSSLSMFAIMGGFLLHLSGLIWLGVLLFSGIVLFQLVTLPVEIGASSLAKKRLSEAGLADENDLEGVGAVLNAAALTYLAAVITSIMTLLYYISRARDRN